MDVIQDSDYVLYKSIAKYVKNELTKPLNALNAKCFKEFSKLEKQKALFLGSETYEDLGDGSKKLKSKRDEFLLLLAVQDRLEKIVEKNEQRIDFISLRLQQMGIYNESVDKKSMFSSFSKESKNVSVDSLNLNPASNGGITFKFFEGIILAFRNDELDLNLEENRDTILDASGDFIHAVVEAFPYAVATIPDDYYMVSDFKNKILKECILYAASKIKNQTIAESNKQLGGLLENVGEMTSISQFANELKNYFNVVVKQKLKTFAPTYENEIDEVLTCNESSRYLPKARIVEKTQVVENVKQEESSDEDDDKIIHDPNESGEEIVKESETQDEVDDKDSDLSTEELLEMLLSDESLDDEENAEKPKIEDSVKEVSSQEIQQDSTEGQSLDEEVDKLLKDIESLFVVEDDDNKDNKE